MRFASRRQSSTAFRAGRTVWKTSTTAAQGEVKIDSPDQLAIHIRNAVSVGVGDGGTFPCRFTAEQMEYFASDSHLKARSVCPAGVCLDFYTSSPWLKLYYSAADPVRDWLFFDVLIDDVFHRSFGQLPFRKSKSHFTIELGTVNRKRVTVFLPHTAKVCLAAIELQDGTRMDPASLPPGPILCLGDSITQGMDAYSPSNSYPVLLSRARNAQLLNQGLGGYYFDPAGIPNLPGFQPELITVAFGTNDWGRVGSMDELAGNSRDFLERLAGLYPSSMIRVITPIWRADRNVPRPSGSFEQLHRAIGSACPRHQDIRVIDGSKLVPHRAQYFRDRKVHPNDRGFSLFAKNLLDTLAAV
jgi:hypothetical protein